MPFFQHAGLRLHFDERGSGAPFLFQHGLGGDTTQPLGLLRPPPGVRLIALDSRAHGQTPLGPPDDLTFATLAGDCAALLDHLAVTSAVAGGISLGAAVALRLALSRPERVRALVLVRPAWLDGALPEANRLCYAEMAGLIRAQGVDGARAAFTATPRYQAVLRASPAAAEAFLRQFDSRRALDAVARLERLPAQAPHPRAEWAGLRAPALVLACPGDKLHPFDLARALAAGLPGAEFEEVPSRHAHPAAHAAAVQAAVEAFLARHGLITEGVPTC